MKILRPEVNACIQPVDGLQDMFDNVIKVLFNITDEEYDFIVANATDADIEVFLKALGSIGISSTFAERRLALELLREKLILFKNTKNS